jgi:hypothetical protein
MHSNDEEGPVTEPSDEKWETPEEVLEREIQDLEQPFLRSWYTWAATLVAAAVLGGLVTLLFLVPSGSTTPRHGIKPPEMILREPRGQLTDVPRTFRWAAVPSATTYIVSVMRSDTGEVVMLRSATQPFLMTIDTEVGRFDSGIYVWTVDAHARNGAALARGQGTFSLQYGGG